MGVSYYNIYRKKRRWATLDILGTDTQYPHKRCSRFFVWFSNFEGYSFEQQNTVLPFLYTAEISPEMKLQFDTIKCLVKTNGTCLES